MLNPWMNRLYTVSGIFGGGFYPIALTPVLTYMFFQDALPKFNESQGNMFRTTMYIDRSTLFIIVIGGVIEMRLHWRKISRILRTLTRIRKMVGSTMTIHPHSLFLVIIYTTINISTFIQKSLTVGRVSEGMRAYFYYSVFIYMMVQYTDMVWTIVDLFRNLNLRLAQELASLNQSDNERWLKLIEVHRELVQNAAELHSCFTFHMLIAVIFHFLKMILLPFQVIRNWLKPAVVSILINPYINLLQIFCNIIYLISLFTPPTFANIESNNTRKVLREFANKGHQREKILSTIRMLSENEFKITFYGLINVRILCLVPMIDAIATNVVILMNYD